MHKMISEAYLKSSSLYSNNFGIDILYSCSDFYIILKIKCVIFVFSSLLYLLISNENDNS